MIRQDFLSSLNICNLFMYFIYEKKLKKKTDYYNTFSRTSAIGKDEQYFFQQKSPRIVFLGFLLCL
jgi:hypothetical protein